MTIDPTVKGSAEAGSTVRVYESPDCTGAVAAQGPAAQFASPGLVASVVEDDTVDFTATATDASGNTSACSDPVEYREDSTAPDTQIDSGPVGTTRDATPTFAFSSEPGASFGCKIDSRGYAPCRSPKTTRHLSDGEHTFSVRARDGAGNVDRTPATRFFTVDTAATLDTKIEAGPSGTTNDPSPTFRFSSSRAGSSFQCRVDSGSYAGCASPKTLSRLKDGDHTFFVRARDRAGSVDPTPAMRSFTLETAEARVSGATLVVTAASGAEDNLDVVQPSDSRLRISDYPSDDYRGSGLHPGAGCVRLTDYVVSCGGPFTQIQITAGGESDRVVNSTAIQSALYGGPKQDTLEGGSSGDLLDGGPGADVLRGMNGDDLLQARDLSSDAKIDCDGGSTPGSTDRADLDLFPRDPNSRVSGCENRRRY